MIIRTGCCKKLPIIFALLAIAILAVPASAQTCLKDEYGKNVQCTANDVRVAFADNPRALDGTALTSCTANSTFSFVADFHVVTTATARENIGLYFQTAGGANALTGTCSANIIAPPHKSSNPLDTVTLGTSQYEELDTSTPTDTCGDISTSDNNQVITVEVDNAKCVAGANGLLALPNCTSWQQPGGTILCVSPAPNYPWVKAAVPGSPSKCNCDNGFTVPIQVQSPSISVTKACTTTNTPGTTNTLCDAGQEGGTVTYTVSITNSSNFGNIIVDQICDSAYGNVFTVAGYGGPACPAGAQAPAIASNVDCPPGGTTGIASGATVTCTFTAAQGESPATVKNTVSVKGHGASSGTFGPSASNQVTVTSTDAPSTATTTKSYVSTTNICATVRYGVDVKNTSGADETLTLSALTDDGFGDITTLQGHVLGTTCGVGTGVAGLGTASDLTGGGALSATLAPGSGEYKCNFDATFCAAPGPLTGTTCNPATGIQHTNKVTPTLDGDEGGETITDSIGSLTVTECVSTQ